MGGFITEEGWHILPDNHRLYTKSWLPKGCPSAVLLFVHGFSDHVNSYYTLFPSLATRGIHVHAFDQRGWGRSVQTISQRGLTGTTNTVLGDMTSVLSTLIPLAKRHEVPLFLMGHSMGGAEVLQYAALGEMRLQIWGFLAESPYLALHPSSQPSRFTVAVGRLAAIIVPKQQMVQKLDSKWLSRDPGVNREWAEDPLCHDTGTLEGLAGMLDRGKQLDKDLVVVSEGKGDEILRILVSHGSEDRITSFEASKRWFERLDVKDKTFKTYEGWYHKLHAEPGADRDIFANDVADWIIARAEARKSSKALGSRSKL